jgi:hypothetical protein
VTVQAQDIMRRHNFNFERSAAFLPNNLRTTVVAGSSAAKSSDAQLAHVTSAASASRAAASKALTAAAV